MTYYAPLWVEECTTVVKPSFEPQTALCVVIRGRGHSTASNTAAELNAQAKHTQVTTAISQCTNPSQLWFYPLYRRMKLTANMRNHQILW
jgi:hypothetical protein